MALHLAHWGAFEADTDGASITAVRPYERDPEPSSLIENLPGAQHHPTRIDRPYVRRGWLEHGPGAAPDRGTGEFVPVSWPGALDLLAGELRRVYQQYGPESVFGGSYGWGSAGRFHHAQSQVHRFLVCAGGYVRSVQNYSYGASQVLLPRIVGSDREVIERSTSWESIAEHTELVVAFGGLAAKNAVVSAGGVGRHDLRGWVARCGAAGTRFVLVSPLAEDMPDEAGMSPAEWISPRPGSDTALLLAVAFVLSSEGLADRDFLARYCVGYERFEAYVRGETDGVAKTPEWAERITTVPAGRIRELARQMARHRTLLTVSWSMQRTRYGEQPLWAAVTVAAMLGQIGLPGGGFGHGYGSAAFLGRPGALVSPPSLPRGRNPVRTFIPVARVADMLLSPGESYRYNGETLRYPDIRLVYWCGGNPFHHHQDLGRLAEAFSRPETIVVHEPFWTATARHADIVLPSTMTVERDDFGAGRHDPLLVAMPALTAPHEQAQDDYSTFAGLAARLGFADEFTEGRDAKAWLRHLYETWRPRYGEALPGFDEFWDAGYVELPQRPAQQVLFADFRADPTAHPLHTPSGRIEIFSEDIDSFGYPDCAGHPAWFEPEDWAHSDRYPLHLIANQPRARLHSQLDVGAHSLASKVRGREPLRIHPTDAAARGLADGEIVRVYNDRGSCLAGVTLTDALRPGVVQLATGSWYDPDPSDRRHCRHGNPNVLTSDRPTSTLSQATAGQHTMVEVERVVGEVPEVTAHRPPPGVTGT